MAIETIRVWSGERKLFSSQQNAHNRVFRCIRGWGYVRFMSESNRQLFKPGNELRVPAGEIVTVSAVQEMMVEMVLINDLDTEK